MRRRQQRQIGAPVTVQKIENVVPRRIRTGGERGPGDRRERRIGRRQPTIAPLRLQLRKVRQQPLLEVLLGQLGILPVEAEHDEPLDPGLRPVAKPDGPNRHPERPDQQRRDGEQHRREHDEEGGQKGKPGTRSDVGIQRVRDHGRGDGNRQAERRQANEPRRAGHLIEQRMVAAMIELLITNVFLVCCNHRWKVPEAERRRTALSCVAADFSIERRIRAARARQQ